MILGLFRKNPRRAKAAELYEAVSDAARNSGLYLKLQIPDTLEGRFEALTLHVVLVLRALGRWPEPASEVSKDLLDSYFRDLDASLREMGVGDTTVPKRMKDMAQAFYGRARAYGSALDAPEREALAASLARNVLGEAEGATALARYVKAADEGLRSQNLDDFLDQGPVFPQPDVFAG